MPKFVAGDDVYVGGKKLETYEALETELGFNARPACSSPQQEATNKIFRFAFDKPVFKYLTVESTWKAAFKVATDGTTFAELGASDTVTVDGKIVTITFNAALTGATNKLRIEASAMQDVFGNTNAQYTTSALTLT